VREGSENSRQGGGRRRAGRKKRRIEGKAVASGKGRKEGRRAEGKEAVEGEIYACSGPRAV